MGGMGISEGQTNSAVGGWEKSVMTGPGTKKKKNKNDQKKTGGQKNSETWGGGGGVAKHQKGVHAP